MTGVLCAVQGPLEEQVVRALDGADAALRVVRRCADLSELLAAAAAGLGRIAVVSADLPLLGRSAVRELAEYGVAVLALTDGRSPDRADRMRAIGAAAVLAADAAADVLVDAARRVLAQTDAEGALPAARPPVAGAPDRYRSGGALDADAGPPREPGSVLAVWGPTGAPGRTTVAINLATELAAGAGAGGRAGARAGAAGNQVLLVDADTYGGAVAPCLGMLDEAPGIAAAARIAGQRLLDAPSLARVAPVLSPGLRVLTGIMRAERWPELSAAALEVVWDTARELADWTVIDCGFAIERDEVLSYDTRAPQRNAATLSALGAADLVLVVGLADPLGLQRLVRALDELRSSGVLSPRARTRVVMNRLRASAVGPRPAEVVCQALSRYAGVEDVVLVPDDRPGVDAAVLAGQSLRERSPGSGARKAFARLAAETAATRDRVAAH